MSRKRCKNADHAERYNDGKCVICAKERARKWILENPERAIKSRKEYYEKNKEKCMQLAKNRYENKKEEIRQYKKEYYLKNKERLTPIYKEHAKKNAVKIRAKAKKWKINNPEKAKLNAIIYQSKRRVKIKTDQKITKEQIYALLNNQKNKCATCFCVLKKYEIDHILPVKLGGKHEIVNLQILCPKCNRSKGALHPAEWANLHGRLL